MRIYGQSGVSCRLVENVAMVSVAAVSAKGGVLVFGAGIGGDADDRARSGRSADERRISAAVTDRCRNRKATPSATSGETIAFALWQTDYDFRSTVCSARFSVLALELLENMLKLDQGVVFHLVTVQPDQYGGGSMGMAGQPSTYAGHRCSVCAVTTESHRPVLFGAPLLRSDASEVHRGMVKTDASATEEYERFQLLTKCSKTSLTGQMSSSTTFSYFRVTMQLNRGRSLSDLRQ